MRALAISAAGRWESLHLAGVISSMSISRIEERYSRPQKPAVGEQCAARVGGGELQDGVAALAWPANWLLEAQPG